MVAMAAFTAFTAPRSSIPSPSASGKEQRRPDVEWLVGDPRCRTSPVPRIQAVICPGPGRSRVRRRGHRGSDAYTPLDSRRGPGPGSGEPPVPAPLRTGAVTRPTRGSRTPRLLSITALGAIETIDEAMRARRHHARRPATRGGRHHTRIHTEDHAPRFAPPTPPGRCRSPAPSCAHHIAHSWRSQGSTEPVGRVRSWT